MILYHPRFATELSDFGINLPLRDDRSQRVFRQLKEHFPQLAEIDSDDVPLLELDDLEGIHSSDFLSLLKSDDTFLTEILKTYECFEKSERYNKDQALKPIAELRKSILRQVSATHYGLEMALRDSFCFYLGGGMHHGQFEKGSGFCPLNDIVIALKMAQKSSRIENAIVIDTDAHFGDGTAQMTRGDESIKTFSIHMSEGWPLDQDNCEVFSSDVDVPVKSGEESLYLEKLQVGLAQFTDEPFDCAIIVAGADPHCDDELLSTQKLKLSSAQMLARDMQVYKWCLERKIPQLWLMAGGYGKGAPDVYTQFILKVLHLMG